MDHTGWNLRVCFINFEFHSRLAVSAKFCSLVFVNRIVKGFPPVAPYVGVSPTLCYLLRDKKSLCCLQLAQVCEHCPFRNAKEHNWPNQCIILAADYASNGIYNFLVPLRAHFHSPQTLRPIILLLERRYDQLWFIFILNRFNTESLQASSGVLGRDIMVSPSLLDAGFHWQVSS